MSNVVNLPVKDEREWILMRNGLLEDYKKMPDGPASLEEAMPRIRAHWDEIYKPVSLQIPFNLPCSLTEEQQIAVKHEIEKGCEIITQQLYQERDRHFALLVGSEYTAAFFQRRYREEATN